MADDLEKQDIFSSLTLDGVRVRAKDVLIDGYLEVESVRAGSDVGDLQGVEVRATTTPNCVEHWKSLRYLAPTRMAPRARDMLRIIVLAPRAPSIIDVVGQTPPTVEQLKETEQPSQDI
jgi:hypothetical protein